MEEYSQVIPTEQISYNKIFLISDLHFGVRANSLEWLNNQMQFFNNFYLPYLRDNVEEGDVLFILGDWFDSRQLLDINVMVNSINVVFDLAKILPVHFITGNHDIYKKHDTDVNSLAAFKFIPNVFIYEKPVIATNGRTKILIMPWIGDKDKEESCIKNNPCDYIFAHTDIAGFQYDNNRTIIKGLNVTKVKGLKRLFSGHIHKRQERQHFIYLGSPYHTKRSDIGNDKGVYSFNPDTNRVKFTPNYLSSVFQRILLEDILEFTLEKTKKMFENNYSDIIVPDKYVHLFNLTKFIDILSGCSYKKIETVGERKHLDSNIVELGEGVDIRDILTLLEMGISDMGHQMETLVKLKLLNKRYYELASRETIE
jgi:UDP-2,3-diacylglucosamine pyrophosphatase LpxH